MDLLAVHDKELLHRQSPGLPDNSDFGCVDRIPQQSQADFWYFRVVLP